MSKSFRAACDIPQEAQPSASTQPKGHDNSFLQEMLALCGEDTELSLEDIFSACSQGDRLHPASRKPTARESLLDELSAACDEDVDSPVDDLLSACVDSGPSPVSSACEKMVFGKRVIDLAGGIFGGAIDYFLDPLEPEMDGATWLDKQGQAFAKASALRGTGRGAEASQLEAQWDCPSPSQANQLEDGGVPEIRESLPHCYK